MAQTINKLTATTVAQLKRPGRYGDGAGVYLQVSKRADGGVNKSWVFVFQRDGRTREMGLGPITTFGLAEVRERAQQCRRQLYDGIDPIDARQAAKAKAKLDAAKHVTFKICAERYIAAHRAAWKNTKHSKQWDATLETYVYPVIGDLPVQNVDVGLVMQILEPIWSTKAETAGRVRGRIEVILDWARVRGFRMGENPARWRGHLDKLLPARSRVRKVKHHTALPYKDLPNFMKQLRKEVGVAARALEFLILTAARTSEVLDLPPSEIDGNVWIVPEQRMKAGREHRVPLSARAREIVEEMARDHQGPFVFPGWTKKKDKPLSNMALLNLLERMGYPNLTAHGFRSTFKDWVSECTHYSSELSEMALAHTIDDKVEAAYRRGDLFQKRLALMGDWACFCAGTWKGQITVPFNETPKAA
jgi:integrase